jgi:glycosyltransferase involved in cell wall biosynthesis
MMESIHTQSFAPKEHIFIDGDSTDGTQEFVKKYEQRGWVSRFVSEKDTGLYNALNKGLRLARGKYIHIMNTDDYAVDHDFFKISIEQLEKGDADFTHAERIVESQSDGSLSLSHGDERVAFFRMPFRHQTMLVRKTIFDELGLFNENHQIASDYEFVLKMLMARKTGFHIPKIFIHSRDGGLSSNKKLCRVEVPQIIYNIYGKRYGLTLEECREIYTGKNMIALLPKILFKIKDAKIRDSLLYSYCPRARKRTILIPDNERVY